MGYQPGKGKKMKNHIYRFWKGNELIPYFFCIGLGKSLQGRSQPVEAQVRKGRGAVGKFGFCLLFLYYVKSINII